MRYGSLLAVITLAGIGAAGWFWLSHGGEKPAAPQGGGRRFAQRNGPVPVTLATVRLETIPVYRDGIGNIQALFSVTVRSQIDGRLSNVDFTEGQMVSKGAVLARIDPVIYQAQYDQALSKKAQDQATLANAKLDFIRYQRLAQSNAGPQQQADQQAAVVAQLTAQVKSDEAAIDNARAFLDYTVITAPLEGRAGLRQVDPGNIIHTSDSGGLVSIAQVAPIAAIFTLPQRDLPTITRALASGAVAVEVLEAGGNGVLARGSLQTMDNQIDVSTGTIKLKAVFPNDDQRLWPGQFVSTRVVVETLADAKVVPTTAIRRGPNGTFVYLVGADERAMVRPVVITMQDETKAVIASGLENGDRVVTVGFAQLADGKPVQIAAEPVSGDGADGATPRRERPSKTEERSKGYDRAQGEAKALGEAKAPGEGRRDRSDGSGERRRRREPTDGAGAAAPGKPDPLRAESRGATQ